MRFENLFHKYDVLKIWERVDAVLDSHLVYWYDFRFQKHRMLASDPRERIFSQIFYKEEKDEIYDQTAVPGQGFQELLGVLPVARSGRLSICMQGRSVLGPGQ